MDRTSRPGSSRSGRVLIENEEPVQPERADNAIGIQNQPEESCCCFTLKGAMITTIATSVTFVILIVILDVTIWQAEREAQYQSYTNLLEIRIHGTPSSFIKIDSFRSYQPSEKYYTPIKIIDLNYAEVDVGKLNSLLDFENSIEIVRLRNVKFYEKWGRRTSVYRSNSLKEFTLEFNQDIGPSAPFQLDQCDQCVVKKDSDDLSGFQDKECLKSLLQFIKPEPAYQESFFTNPNMNITFPSSLQQMKISIKINSWTYLKHDPETQEFTTVLNNCNQILNQLRKPSIKKLFLKNCNDLEYSTLSKFSEYVTHLTLDTFNITGFNNNNNKTLSSLLGSFTGLEELVVKAYPYQVIDLDKPVGVSSYLTKLKQHFSSEYQINFAELPITLKNISLSNVRIIANQTINLKLDQLALHTIAFEDRQTPINLLNTNGAHCKRIAWQEYLYIHRYIPTAAQIRWYDVLDDMLRISPSANLEWIFMETEFNLVYASTMSRLGPLIFRNKFLNWDKRNEMTKDTLGTSVVLTKDFSTAGQDRVIPWNIQEKIPYENTVRVKVIWSEFFNIHKFLDPAKIIKSKW